MQFARHAIARCLKIETLVFACLACAPGFAAQTACSPHAEESAAHLKTWMQLQDHFHKYGRGRCDKGALSEAYSERVAAMLTGNWKGISTLAFLTKSDPEFRQFVLRHIDATWNQGDAGVVAADARKSCPKSAKRLCHDIAKSADALQEEQASNGYR